MPDQFWTTIKEQLKELKSAENADDVIRILSPERNPYGPEWDGMDGAASGFFAGSGSGDTIDDALDDAGWSFVWSAWAHHYCMKAPDGSMITYIEGDIYRGNKR
ncbi:hypothetical protein ACFYY2_12145 [Streptomyces sp. NPDC001822]|uniref:hypothetical protein n=1 Tax=Streptomyces sp. NPDC001822 TaxID=3364614 RepID=UPI0036A98685